MKDDSKALINAKSKKWDNYHEYLESEEWKNLKEEFYGDNNYRCEICGIDAKNIYHTHHWKYPQTDWFYDEIDNLVCLCQDCHKLQHELNDKESWKGGKWLNKHHFLYEATRNYFYAKYNEKENNELCNFIVDKVVNNELHFSNTLHFTKDSSGMILVINNETLDGVDCSKFPNLKSLIIRKIAILNSIKEKERRNEGK